VDSELGDTMVTMNLTGGQIYLQRIMKTSGFHYTWDSTRPAGGDGFTTFVSGTNQVGGPIDLDVLIAYVKAHTPFTPRWTGSRGNRPRRGGRPQRKVLSRSSSVTSRASAFSSASSPSSPRAWKVAARASHRS
jgi:hypothetical protein